MSVDLAFIQRRLALWRAENFPGYLPADQILGMTEELGELAHAHLKFSQGIRGYDVEKFEQEARDAIGDLIIYAMGYCDVYRWDLATVVRGTAHEVLKRNWKQNPKDGS